MSLHGMKLARFISVLILDEKLQPSHRLLYLHIWLKIDRFCRNVLVCAFCLFLSSGVIDFHPCLRFDRFPNNS